MSCSTPTPGGLGSGWLRRVGVIDRFAVANLYESLVRESRAIRLARASGYRSDAWSRLEQAAGLNSPNRDVEALRHEAVACMGDFVGLEPTSVPRGNPRPRHGTSPTARRRRASAAPATSKSKRWS